MRDSEAQGDQELKQEQKNARQKFDEIRDNQDVHFGRAKRPLQQTKNIKEKSTVEENIENILGDTVKLSDLEYKDATDKAQKNQTKNYKNKDKIKKEEKERYGKNSNLTASQILSGVNAGYADLRKKGKELEDKLSISSNNNSPESDEDINKLFADSNVDFESPLNSKNNGQIPREEKILSDEERCVAAYKTFHGDVADVNSKIVTDITGKGQLQIFNASNSTDGMKILKQIIATHTGFKQEEISDNVASFNEIWTQKKEKKIGNIEFLERLSEKVFQSPELFAPAREKYPAAMLMVDVEMKAKAFIDNFEKLKEQSNGVVQQQIIHDLNKLRSDFLKNYKTDVAKISTHDDEFSQNVSNKNLTHIASQLSDGKLTQKDVERYLLQNTSLYPFSTAEIEGLYEHVNNCLMEKVKDKSIPEKDILKNFIDNEQYRDVAHALTSDKSIKLKDTIKEAYREIDQAQKQFKPKTIAGKIANVFKKVFDAIKGVLLGEKERTKQANIKTNRQDMIKNKCDVIIGICNQKVEKLIPLALAKSASQGKEVEKESKSTGMKSPPSSPRNSINPQSQGRQ